MKIGIIGGYGFHNWGDDAQLINTVYKLKEKGFYDLLVFTRQRYIQSLVECNICPDSHDIFKSYKTEKEYITRYQYIMDNLDNLRNLSLIEKRFVKNIKSLDVLLFSGSGVINTRHLSQLYLFLLPCLIAKKFGKKV